MPSVYMEIYDQKTSRQSMTIVKKMLSALSTYGMGSWELAVSSSSSFLSLSLSFSQPSFHVHMLFEWKVSRLRTVNLGKK